MNQKGLTLIEMIGVLIVLAAISTIVVPTINGSIKDYREQLFETQINNITSASKNWSADNVDKLPNSEKITINDTEYTYGLKITIQELQEGGYISDKLKNPKTSKYFSESDVFTLITCKMYIDETGNYSSNYNYTYETYININDYLEKQAVKYAKDNSLSSTNITTSQLQSSNYVIQKIVNTNNTNTNIPSKTIQIVENNGEYKATVQ